MVFDVESLNTEEIIATKVILERLTCTHEKLACVECPCFEICTFVGKVTEQCKNILAEREFS